MIESIVNFVSEHGLVWGWLKFSVFLFIATYVIEEVLGKYLKAIYKLLIKLFVKPTSSTLWDHKFLIKLCLVMNEVEHKFFVYLLFINT